MKDDLLNLNELTLEEKIGQMIIVGMNGKTITNRIEKLILNYKIGGIILYRRNYDTYEELLAIINQIRQLNSNNKIPMFIAVDQEGGRVNRMPSEFKNLLSPKKIANSNDISLIRRSGNAIGKMLYETGFNMDFAPVLDIQRFKNKHAIGDRCYGENNIDVTKYGVEVMKQIKKNKVLPVIKHFPGHGLVKTDSHYFLPSINKFEDIKNDVVPFEEAIKQGADAIMVGHMIVKNISNIFPATLSRKFIYKMIRKKYRYNRLIITDDFKMRSVRYFYGPTYSVKRAINSGYDIAIFRYNEFEEDYTIRHLNKIAKKGKINVGNINRSVKRIINTKQKYGLFEEHNINGCNIDEINNEINSINEECKKYEVI